MFEIQFFDELFSLVIDVWIGGSETRHGRTVLFDVFLVDLKCTIVLVNELVIILSVTFCSMLYEMVETCNIILF